jgi:hypothetical protein
MSLENKVAIAKPSLLEADALIFGVARILAGDIKGAASFYKERIEKGKSRDLVWLQWYYAFSLLLDSDFENAAVEFKPLAVSASDALVTGLSAYFLSENLRKNVEDPMSCRETSDIGRDRVKQSLKGKPAWDKEAAKIGTEVHTAFIQQYIKKAGSWIYGLL